MGLAGLALGIQGIANSAQTLGQGLAGAPGRPQPQRPPQRRAGGLADAGLGLSTEPAAHPEMQLPYPVGRSIDPRKRTAIGKHIASGNTQLLERDIKTLNERVRWIRDRITKSLKDPETYKIARKKILSKRTELGDWAIKEKDNYNEAKAIFDWTRKKIRYTSDTYSVDTFATAAVTLDVEAGDCDDYSTVLCTLCMSAGLPCKLVVVATKNSARMVDGVLLPNPDHIYAAVGLPRSAPSKWIPMDASVPVEFGWQVPVEALAEVKPGVPARWVYKATL